MQLDGIKKIGFLILIVFLISFQVNAAIIKNPDIEVLDEPINNTYLGVQPPGLKPQVFAPEILNPKFYRIHSFPAFSPAGDELFFAVIPPKVIHMKLEEGKWSIPKTAAFSKGNIQAPIFSPDGDRVYFQMSSKTGYGSLDLWFATRNDTGWSEPQLLPMPPNSEKLESQPSLTKDGSLYFTGSWQGSGWNRGIYRSQFTDSGYREPELLPAPINSQYIDTYPFISPDEKFLLFSSSRPMMEEANLKLYVSWHNDNGWSKPYCISDYLKVEPPVRYACISSDTKYLFFMHGGRIYWVDAEVIKIMKNNQ